IRRRAAEHRGATPVVSTAQNTVLQSSLPALPSLPPDLPMALDLTELKTRDLSDLLALAEQLKIDNAASLKRQDLILEILRNKVLFDNLEAQHADHRLPLEATPALRIVDLLAPLGLGQRIAVHGPLHAGRTRLIVDLVNGIAQASPEIVVLVVLVDERPEEID